MTEHTIGTDKQHLEARLALLEAEKEHTRRGDELARMGRALPWVAIEKEYVFETDEGEMSLPELFDGRSQLLVYHFMFGPQWIEGCPICSFWADNFNGAVIHLAHHDVTMLGVSRAPLERLQDYERRMGWSFPWVSSGRNDFNYDFGMSVHDLDAGASQPEMERPDPDRTDLPAYNFTKKAFAAELPGMSAFALDDGTVYHTYSCYARGLDAFNAAYQLLDRAPLGRNEESFRWIQRHDQYQDAVGTPTAST
jgi:predicted dithiol-disulfide oxidoreductase (DUF899 family)